MSPEQISALADAFIRIGLELGAPVLGLLCVTVLVREFLRALQAKWSK